MSTRPAARRRPSGPGLRTLAVLLVGLALLAVAYGAWRGTPGPAAAPPVTIEARQRATDPATGLRWIDEASLPVQARQVLARIDQGGPYEYDKDGSTFMNVEGLLPKKPNGFYREYTVVLPGSRDRGPVRIVVGGKGEMYFWTTDHYASFSRIRR